jgi:hypothetical protein
MPTKNPACTRRASPSNFVGVSFDVRHEFLEGFAFLSFRRGFGDPVELNYGMEDRYEASASIQASNRQSTETLRRAGARFIPLAGARRVPTRCASRGA